MTRTGRQPGSCWGRRGIAVVQVLRALRRLTESGHAVRVLPTASALKFVGAATFEALVRAAGAHRRFADVPPSGTSRSVSRPTSSSSLRRPRTCLARAAQAGDDLLTAALLTACCPVLLVPAMHTEMWEHPATRDNVGVLRSRGAVVLELASGRLTGRDTGPAAA